MRRFLPLLAQCGLATAPDEELLADHIIVDEAQDIAPLEWRLISLINRAHAWTLLGDVNQRRSDWTYHSSEHVGADLGLTQDDGSVPLRVAGPGTAPPRRSCSTPPNCCPGPSAECTRCSRTGWNPRSSGVRTDRLHAEAVGEAQRLLTAHPGGAVTVIGLPPRRGLRYS